LLSETVGKNWVTDPSRLRVLEDHASEPGFVELWHKIKRLNKNALAKQIHERTGVVVDPSALFDIQVKRIHEYKRQHLNVLHIIALYRRLQRDPAQAIVPRCFVFGGKAAPGYRMAKLIIRLINGVAEAVNVDPVVDGRLKVVFFPDFNVKNAHAVYPAADLSEQISTAGKEASGTGNMKFMLNGALTIGTLDGANVEMREEAGDENFFLFGLTADEVERVKRDGYRPGACVERNAELREVLELVASGHFSRGDKEVFRPLVDNLLHSDPFLVLADFDDYAACQAKVDTAWKDAARWTRMSIMNTARAGKFSSDRAIREYCDRIWKAKPVPVSVDR
jgi:starch phosphorylase